MALPKPTAPVTAEHYLRWKADQPDKDEYFPENPLPWAVPAAST